MCYIVILQGERVPNCMYEGYSSENYLYIKHVKTTVIPAAAQPVLCMRDPLTGKVNGIPASAPMGTIFDGLYSFIQNNP
jgi:hypothetical protein